MNRALNIEQYFKDEIKRISEQEMKEIKQEMEEMKERAISELKEEYKRESDSVISFQLQELEQDFARKKAKIYENANASLVKVRNQMQQQVFEEVKERLQEFTKQKEYEQLMCKKLQKLAQLNEGEVVLQIAQQDESYIDTFVNAYGKECDVTVVDTISLGGFLLVCKQSRKIYDETLDTAIKEQEKWFFEHSGLVIS